MERNHQNILALQALGDVIDANLDDVFVLRFASSDVRGVGDGVTTRREAVRAASDSRYARVSGTETINIHFAKRFRVFFI